MKKNINEYNQEIGDPVNHWQTAKMPFQKNIEGQYCVLVPLNAVKHSMPLFEVLHDNPGESWTYLPYGPFETFEQFSHWINKSLAEKDSFFYAIIDEKTNHPVGVCAYLRMNPEQGVVEVGHLNFSGKLKKSTAATEAMYLMMQQAFDLGYRRYEWKCNAFNKPSWAAAERLGFKFEGVFRQHLIVKDCNRDTAWFSVIDAEWPKLKARFQAWLNQKNFDEKGNQIKQLKDL